MLIKAILTHTFKQPEIKEIQNEIKGAKHLKNVSNRPIKRGNSTIEINHHVYKAAEFDIAVNGSISKLLQFNSNLVIPHSSKAIDYDVITPLKNKINDVDITKYSFIPANKEDIQMKSEKVVGTTFAFKENGLKQYTDFDGDVNNENGTPTLKGSAVLLPEPDNQYDPHAIAVVVKLKDGNSFKLGYLPKGSELYNNIKKPTLAELNILAYSENGDYNDSYTVTMK